MIDREARSGPAAGTTTRVAVPAVYLRTEPRGNVVAVRTGDERRDDGLSDAVAAHDVPQHPKDGDGVGDFPPAVLHMLDRSHLVDNPTTPVGRVLDEMVPPERYSGPMSNAYGETWADARRTRSGATRQRHADEQRSGGRERDETFDGRPLPEMPTLGEIERRIMRCDDELAELVEDHFHAAEETAEAESRWKSHRDRVLVIIANSPDTGAADIREAKAKRTREDSTDPASPLGEDLYHTYKIMEAREKSIDRAIRAIQTRMTGLMSVAKGLREVTGTGERY